MTYDDIVKLLRERTGADKPDSTMEIPPKVIVDMQGELLAFDEEAQTLKARFPVLERYQNPIGYMQGGIMVAMMDNTMGPLSYLVAPPSVTTVINITYVRPVPPNEKTVFIRAKVTEKTRRQIYLEATATNEAGKILAMCTSTSVVIE